MLQFWVFYYQQTQHVKPCMQAKRHQISYKRDLHVPKPRLMFLFFTNKALKWLVIKIRNVSDPVCTLELKFFNPFGNCFWFPFYYFITLLNHGKFIWVLLPFSRARYTGYGRPLTKGRKKSNKKTMKHTLKPRQSHTFWTLTFYLINNNGVVYLWDFH